RSGGETTCPPCSPTATTRSSTWSRRARCGRCTWPRTRTARRRIPSRAGCEGGAGWCRAPAGGRGPEGRGLLLEDAAGDARHAALARRSGAVVVGPGVDDHRGAVGVEDGVRAGAQRDALV